MTRRDTERFDHAPQSALAALISAYINDGYKARSEAFPREIGVSEYTVSRWITGRVNPANDSQHKQIFQNLSRVFDMPEAALRQLARMSIKEACQQALERQDRQCDPPDDDQQARLLSLVVERRERFPAAAYAMYAIGNTRSRWQLIEALERQGDHIAADVSFEALALITQLSSSAAADVTRDLQAGTEADSNRG